MKILVAVKRVVDYNVRIRVKPDGSGVETQGVKMSMNPFDEIAVEEAVRLKEKGMATEVVAVTIGPRESQEVLRTAIAIGADRAIHVECTGAIESLTAAKLLCKVAEQEQPNLIIIGKQAIDDDASQTGPMLAALLGWPQATFASTLVLEGGHAAVTREVDGGLMTVRVALPCVVSTDLRLNEPRYPTLPNIMKARGKPLTLLQADQMGVALTPRTKLLKVEEPSRRKAGIKVKDVAELVGKLRDEARVI